MANDRLIQDLRRSGLGDKAAAIYAALLSSGGAYPSALAYQTHINRSTVYKILLDLSVKGLVTEVERGKKQFYQPEKPAKLLKYAETRAEMAREASDRARELIPELEGIFGMNPNKPTIRFFQDRDGIASIYDEMVAEKRRYEMIAFSHGEAFKGYLPAKLLRRFVEAKEKRGITTRAIVPDTAANRAYNTDVFKGLKKNVWPVLRYVPKEIFPFEAEMTLYGDDKLAITKLRGEKLIGIVIEDKLIHDMFRMIFELVWKSDQVKR